jgi:transposase
MAAAACAAGISVAKLAREHGVNAKLLFTWRRQYRAGKFGAPDPAHLPEPSGQDLALAASPSDTAVRLLPVQAPDGQLDAITVPQACIEVTFRSATVRICGAPEIAALRVVLDTLARRL